MRPGLFGEETSLLTLRRVKPRAVQSAPSPPMQTTFFQRHYHELYKVELKPTMISTLETLTENHKAKEARIYTGVSV
jgi:hypothetical protein